MNVYMHRLINIFINKYIMELVRLIAAILVVAASIMSAIGMVAVSINGNGNNIDHIWMSIVGIIILVTGTYLAKDILAK